MNHPHRFRSRRLGALVLAATVLCLGTGLTRAAAACTPGLPPTPTTLVFSDAPACVVVTVYSAFLMFDNQCDEAFSVHVDHCDDCEEIDVEVASGDRVALGLGAAPLKEGQTSEQHLSWVLGVQSGTMTTQLEKTPPVNIGSCDGCSVSGAPASPFNGLPLMVAFWCLLRWRKAS